MERQTQRERETIGNALKKKNENFQLKFALKK